MITFSHYFTVYTVATRTRIQATLEMKYDRECVVRCAHISMEREWVKNPGKAKWMEFYSRDGSSLFHPIYNIYFQYIMENHSVESMVRFGVGTLRGDNVRSCYFNQNRNPVISLWTTVFATVHTESIDFNVFSPFSLAFLAHVVVHCWKCITRKTLSAVELLMKWWTGGHIRDEGRDEIEQNVFYQFDCCWLCQSSAALVCEVRMRLWVLREYCS